MSWLILHQFLHALMVSCFVSAGLLYLLGIPPRMPRRLPLIAVACMFLGCAVWAADAMIINAESPSIEETGTVTWLQKRSGKSSTNYYVRLRTDQGHTPELRWPASGSPPHRGDVVTLTEPAWNIGDTTHLHEISGANAGLAWQAHDTTGFLVFVVGFCLGLAGWLLSLWKKVPATSTAPRERRGAVRSA